MPDSTLTFTLPGPLKDDEGGAPKTRDCIVLMAGERALHVDDSFARVFGYDDPAEIRENPFSILVHPDDRERVEEITTQHLQGQKTPHHYEFRGLRKDGRVIFIEASAALLEYGGHILNLLHLTDVTDRGPREKELLEREEKYRALFENSLDPIYISKRDGRLIDVNRAFLDLFGYTREEALTLNAKKTFGSRDRQRFRETMRRSGYLKDFAVTLKRKDGTVMECLLSLNPIHEEGGRISGFQGTVRDITAIKKAQEDVRYMAYHDSLTGLPNRLLFTDRLEMAIVNAARHSRHIAVMMLDLDMFKDVNDTYGHDRGDKLLRAVADRLQETVRKSDTVSRMGGDEFLLVLPEISEVADTFVVGEKIMHAFRRAFTVSDLQLFVTCSVGIAIYPDHGSDGETLIRCADAAMYDIKRDGGNSYRLGRREGAGETAPETGFGLDF